MSPEMTFAQTRIEKSLVRSANPIRRDDLLPLWLTAGEAEAVLQLCAAAPAFVGEAAEAAVFGKLGELLRAFRS